jgi:hypothetical protein
MLGRWWLTFVIVTSVSVPIATRADEVSFFRERVQPLFVRHCYECHSHNAKELQGGLTLDSRSGWAKGGDSGPAVVPGKPDESLLIKAVRRTSKDLQMPPSEPLKEADVAVLVEWVKRGAIDPRASPDSERGNSAWEAKLAERRQHWCWQPVKRPVVPPGSGSPIDAFLDARIAAAGLEPAAAADRWSLARRLSVVLTGLPLDPADLEAFVADESPDAFEKLVDRTLASPQFGEHWARHWMDLIRYSDTHGSEHDPLIPHAWRYRDYLVRAFNADVPYDRFVREHLAGDLLPPRWNPTLGINESPIGTGWFRFVEFYPTPIDVKNEEIVVIDAQIDAFSKTFQGLTIACARCHDHKFDAISAHDFAALYGVFASSRTTMHRVSDPAVQHAFDQQLVELKRPIRRALAELWREQLTHWPTAILAARDRVNEPDPPRPTDKDKPAAPMPPPFAPGTRSVEAESHRWLTALKAAKGKPAEPLSAIARLAVEHVSNMPLNSTAIDSKLWSDLANERRAFHDRRAAASQRFRWFADFGMRDVSPALDQFPSANNTENSETQSGADLPHSQDWFAVDNFHETHPAGEFSVSPTGGVLTVILPSARSTHLVSNKHGGTFRSPNFTLDMKFVSVLAGGTNGARVRLVIENFAGDGVLFTQVMPTVNEPRLRWVTLGVREAWTGRRAYLEIIPRDEMPYPGKHPDMRVLRTDGRSGVSVRAVVFHDQPGAPELSSPLPEELWQVESNWPKFVDRLATLAGDAIDAWSNERCSDEQARFVDELLRTGVLLNEPPAGSELAQLVARYRELEARIPIPTRVPGVADEQGFDEHIFPRGNHRQPGPTVARRYLEVLGGKSLVDASNSPLVLGEVGRRPGEGRATTIQSSGRRELAEAIVDPRNPLTARVMVNRLWQHVFGVGLVKSVDNFGALGEKPSHPELLDWLAAEFVESGWSIKHMLRLMLTSRAFQRSTEASAAARERDPDNRLLSHAHVRRLEAESLRDALLFVSGRLDRRQEGPNVPLPLRSAYKDFENPVSGPLDGDGRRSVYLEARRNYPQPLLIAFDQPKPVLTVGARNVTNVPAQSLMLLNDPFVVSQAELLSARVRSLPTPDARIRTLWLWLFARPVTDVELARSIDFLKSHSAALGAAAEAWRNDPAVWNDFAHALINSKEFLYLR